MNYKQEILDIRKRRGISVAKLAEITKIPADRIYKWESGVGNPKADDSVRLRKWAANPEEIPNNVEEPQSSYGTAMTVIADLTASNRMLAEANLLLATTINSSVVGKASESGSRGGKGKRPDLSDVGLSGKRKPPGSDRD